MYSIGWWIILLITGFGISYMQYLLSIIDIHQPYNLIKIALFTLLLNYGSWWVFYNSKSFIITWLLFTSCVTIGALLLSIFYTKDIYTYKTIVGFILILTGCILINIK